MVIRTTPRAVITEHNNYLRSISSLACSHHLGLVLLDDWSLRLPDESL